MIRRVGGRQFSKLDHVSARDMLDVDSAASFLLSRALIDVEWIIDGTLEIRSLPRRNRNLIATGRAGTGFVIKQPDDPGHGGHATLRTEANYYRLCEHESDLEEIRRFVPRLLDDDPEHGRLVLESIPDTTTLRVQLEQNAQGPSSVAAARRLGADLATLHRCFRRGSLQDDERVKAFPADFPGR